MRDITPRISYISLLDQGAVKAMAWVTGSGDYSSISGLVKFYDAPYNGTLVEAEFFGLPDTAMNNDKQPSSRFFAMHIHEKGDCTPPYENTGEHYNPTMKPHPYHVGDLLPLLGNQGYAWSAFFDRQLRIKDIINRSVIVHMMPDDFMTQPSGNAGTKIACGVIKAM